MFKVGVMICDWKGNSRIWKVLGLSLMDTDDYTRRLYLPCIIFPVRGFSIRGNHRSDEKLYHAKISGLGDVEVTTTDDLALDKRKKFVLAHPRIRHVRGPSSGVTGENDSGSDTDTDSGVDGSTGLDEDMSSHAVAVPLVGSYSRALEMIARLGQPFNALLLVQQPGGEYKRVAADNDIFVPGLGTDIDPKDIRARVLEIL
ncbi:hypothetical protein BKA83DRAFT_4543534 [Pisolithus microcarpus]|nr:hypothetical protein BKA83DRAFT_4543534 [Pisolithus microcarpus]